MVYDPALRSVVLFGGCWTNDTWEYRGGIWENVTPGSSPPALCDASAIYDPLSERVILFGGRTSQGLNETWAYNGTAWEELYPSSAPSPRWSAFMTYDAADGWNLLVGGQDNQTWIFGAGNVSFTTTPASGGAVRVGSTLYPDGTSAWLPYGLYTPSLAPDPGFYGTNLSLSENLTPYNGSYALTGNATLHATFQAFPTVTLLSRPPGCHVEFNGTSYPSGSAPYFAPGVFPLAAPACPQLQFQGWEESGNATIANLSSNSTTVTLSGSATITARFAATVYFYVSPSNVGAIVFNGSRVAPATPMLFLTQNYSLDTLAAPGWRLSSLTAGGGVALAPGTASISFSGYVSADFVPYPLLTVSSNFPSCGPLELNATPWTSGSTTNLDPGAYPLDAPACVSAIFQHWNVSGGATVGSPLAANTTLHLTANGTVEAIYGAAAWVAVSVSPSPSAGAVEWNGSRVTNSSAFEALLGSYPIGAVPAAGWQFDRWEASGGVVLASTGVLLNGNGTVTAVFVPVSPGGHPIRTTPGSTLLGLSLWEWGVVAAVAVSAAVVVGLLKRRRGGKEGETGEPPSPGTDAHGGEVAPTQRPPRARPLSRPVASGRTLPCTPSPRHRSEEHRHRTEGDESRSEERPGEPEQACEPEEIECYEQGALIIR